MINNILNKIKNKTFLMSVLIVVSIWGLGQLCAPLWWYFQDFTNPNYYSDVQKSWEKQNKSTYFLMRHLESRYSMYRAIATTILAQRKDPKTIKPLIKWLKTSKNRDLRVSAIGILAQFDDPQITEAFIQILKSGRSNPDYLYIVNVFASKHEDFIYPEILSMAKDNFHNSWVVNMLENFPEKPETLSVLEKIAKDDPEDYIRDKAKKATEHIKSSQKY